MTDLRQAAQQVLEALEAETSESWECNSYHPKIQPAMTALKQALAEHEQEPISLNNGRLTQYPDGSIGLGKPTHKPQTTHWEGCEAVHPECKATPRKPLTDEEIVTIWGQKPRWHAPPIGSTDIDFARAVIAAYEAKQGDQT